MIEFYTIGCPQCNVLKRKLDNKNISYNIIDELDVIIQLGYTQLPVLVVDGHEMNFKEAVQWVNER